MSLPVIAVLNTGGPSAQGCRDLIQKAGGMHSDLNYRDILDLTPENIRQEVAKQMAGVNYIMLPGNDSDVDPALYGEERHPKTIVNPDKRRELFEREVIRQATEKGIPMFGICGGMQQMVVHDGGTMVQHVENHHQERSTLSKASHGLVTRKGTELDAIRKAAKIDELQVNSFHHQAVKEMGRSLKISALATDGVTEGVESKIGAMKPTWGVQFHPELMAENSFSTKIASAVLNGAKTHAAKILLNREIEKTLGPHVPSRL